MIAITTSSSISVKPRRPKDRCMWAGPYPGCCAIGGLARSRIAQIHSLSILPHFSDGRRMGAFVGTFRVPGRAASGGALSVLTCTGGSSGSLPQPGTAAIGGIRKSGRRY